MPDKREFSVDRRGRVRDVYPTSAAITVLDQSRACEVLLLSDLLVSYVMAFFMPPTPFAT